MSTPDDKLADALMKVLGNFALEKWLANLHMSCQFAIEYKRAGLTAPAPIQPVIDAMIAVDDLVRGIALAQRMTPNRTEGTKTVEEAMAVIDGLRTKVER